MKQENKTKSVKKFSIKMLLAMVFGGVLGGFFGVFMYYFHGDLEAFLTTWTKMVQSILVPGLLIVNIVSILAGEFCLWKLKTVCDRIATAEDEEADLVSYQEEKYGAILQCVNAVSQVLCIFLLANGYQIGYIESSNKNAINILIACGLFVACFFYNGIMQDISSCFRQCIRKKEEIFPPENSISSGWRAAMRRRRKLSIRVLTRLIFL